LKIAMIFWFAGLCLGGSAQEYSVTPDASQKSAAPPAKKQAAAAQQAPAAAPDQQLGFGSNIQNARLARGAEIALQQGNRVQALDYARRAAQAAPSNPQLWFLVGYAARLNGRFGESIEAYNRGLKLTPGSVEGLSGLAQSYAGMGRNEEAQKILKKTIAENPRRIDDILLLGDLTMRAGDYAGAIEWLLNAERQRAAARSELLLAISYQHLKQMDQANKYLSMAERRAPDNPEVERSMAGYYRETGNFTQAIAQLKAIRNPKPDVIAEMAYTYQLAGKPDESARLYVQAANAVPRDLNLQLSAAQAEIAAGSIDKSKLFLDRAATIDANHYRLHAILGEVAKLQDRNQDALHEYQTAIANLPKDPGEGPLYGIQLHVNLMGIYKDLDDEAGARSELATAQSQIDALGDQTGNRGGFLRLRALIRLSAGNPEGALSDMKAALAINAHDRDSLQLDGDILMKLGRTDEAIAAYKQVLDADPVNRSALTSLGYASRVAGRDKDAEQYFERLAKVAPELYVPYVALGDLYTARRDFARAQNAYEKAYALAPDRSMIEAGGLNAAIEAHLLPLGQTWLGRITPAMEKDPQILREKERYLSFKGDDAASAAVGEKAIAVLPKDRDVVVYLGYDLLHLEKWDELLALTTKYLDVFPKEPDIPLLQGYVHKHTGDSDAALADFTEALKRDPNVVTAYVNRGYTLNDLHKARAAAADFEAAITRDPKNGEAHLGLAYSYLDLGKPQAALRETEATEKILGDSRDIHLIRATAYGRQDMLHKAADEYRAALKFTPDDGAIHLGLANVIFAERRYHDAIVELNIALKDAPDNPEAYAMLARSYANLQQREPALQNVKLAEQLAEHPAPPTPPPADVTAANENKPVVKPQPPNISGIYVSTGEALSTLGERDAAMERFAKALSARDADRVGVRLAIAELMAQQDRTEDAERQIALAQMEGEAGEANAPTGSQYIAAADVFRALHEYQLSQTYLERAKAAGAPDAQVRIGFANNYLAIGDATRAQGELAAVSAEADSAPDYQYLLAKANVARQQHHNAEALTSFALATNAEGEDQTAETSLLDAGANEGLRLTPALSVLGDFSIDPVFEDSTVYVLDAKLDATFPVGPTQTSLLPPPRSSLQTQNTDAFHLQFNRVPTITGFFQVRNARGEISVPATNSIVNRNTTDYAINGGINPVVNLGHNVLQFNLGIQEIIRRDSEQPTALDQNLFRQFAYLSTSSFFNAISVSGYAIHESGPFSEMNEHSSATAAGVDFRVGAPWGRTALVTGWSASDQRFTPIATENYFTTSYIGAQHRFGEHLDVKALLQDVRAWRVVGANSGIAQNVRPAGTVNYALNRSWDFQLASAWSSTRSFHVYDQIQNAFAVSYARPFRRRFNDDTGSVLLEYPIRFSGGVTEETFYNFSGSQSTQFRPYVRISLF
jgi:tetratricopeptide (TPR) repeat protein